VRELCLRLPPASPSVALRCRPTTARAYLPPVPPRRPVLPRALPRRPEPRAALHAPRRSRRAALRCPPASLCSAPSKHAVSAAPPCGLATATPHALAPASPSPCRVAASPPHHIFTGSTKLLDEALLEYFSAASRRPCTSTAPPPTLAPGAPHAQVISY
jgi:hypothetical protein